jgi:hypothetical protein
MHGYRRIQEQLHGEHEDKIYMCWTIYYKRFMMHIVKIEFTCISWNDDIECLVHIDVC